MAAQGESHDRTGQVERVFQRTLASYFFPEYDELAALGLRIKEGVMPAFDYLSSTPEYVGGMSEEERRWVDEHAPIIRDSPRTQALGSYNVLKEMYDSLPRPFQIAWVLIMWILILTVIPKMLWILFQGAGSQSAQLLLIFAILVIVFWVRFKPYDYDWGT